MRRYLSAPWRIALAFITLGVGAVALAWLGAYQFLYLALPDVAAIRDIQLQVPMRVYSRDGRLIDQFGEQRRIPLSFEQIPEQMVNAVLAAEDDSFFKHGGVDYPGLARATVRHLLSGEKSEGGSTITMQLTRGIFLSPEKSYRRKLLEIFLTLRIEKLFTKQEILTLYLNKMFLGQRAYGVGAAAEVYFGKTIDELTLPEIALIAGTFRLPSRDNPVANADLARQRRSYVLRRMLEKQFITPEEHAAANAAPVESKLHGYAVEVEAPYVAEMVRAELFRRYGNDAYTAGYAVTTTIDSRLQKAANRAVRAGLLEYDQRHGYRGPAGRVALSEDSREEDWTVLLSGFPTRGGLEPAVVLSVHERSAVAWSTRRGRLNLDWSALSWAREPRPDGSVGPPPQRAGDVVARGDVIYVARDTSGNWRMVQIPEAQAAFVAMDPQDGSIVALVGGFDYFASAFNRAVQAKRQPGSAFKPFLYSAALDRGFTAASMINDAPWVVDDPGLEAAWRPRNDSREFRGPMRLREALVRSRNLVSIRLMHALGPAYVTQYIQRFGFPEKALPRNLTLALGTAQVSPLEMARGYSVFANGGYLVEPYFIERILVDNGGKLVFQAAPRFACERCIEPAGELLLESEGAPPAAPPSFQTDESRWGGLNYFDEHALAPQVISPQNSYVMTDIMADVVRRGTGARARQLGRNDLAGKTGTTNDGRDAWFCGYTTSLVGAAWVGFDQERPLGRGEQGSRTALPIWIYFMAEALQGIPEHRRAPPPGIVTMRISAETGMAARPDEEHAMFETFIEGHLPPAPDPDSMGSFPAGFGEYEASSEEPLF